MRISHTVPMATRKCCTRWIIFATLFTAACSTKPNILFIIVDDMGWNDVSWHGSDQIQTPNLDALAMQGVMCENYYSEAICTPARSALLTGKYPMRIGMHGLPLYNGEDRGIPLRERLLPSYLKELGYATHLVGKWHVGMSKEAFLPLSRGYDSHYGMRGGFVDSYTYEKVELWPNGRLFSGLDLFDNNVPQENEDRYAIDVLTARAINLIQNHNSSTPMFLHLAHTAPHAGNDGSGLQPPLNQPVKNRHIVDSNRRLYAAIINYIDQSVGKVVKALADKQILDNTIIVFQSDNGAPTTGIYANWGVNLPFRGKKDTPWEGGVRVPAFVWHSSFRPRVWNGLMHITDWLPTLVAAAGGQVTSVIDGVNQWDSIINENNSQRREVLISIHSELGYAAYRAGDYKIVVGNVSLVSNGFYGDSFLVDKAKPPEYFPALINSDAAKALQTLGFYFDLNEVQALRKATEVRQLDTIRDSNLCIPSPSKGCLFNVRRDPTETHDLWYRSYNIATLLTARLRSLWAQQSRRPPLKLDDASDPANFNYVWMPWINNFNDFSNDYTNKLNQAIEDELRNKTQANMTLASEIDCNDNTGLPNFLCLLKSVF